MSSVKIYFFLVLCLTLLSELTYTEDLPSDSESTDVGDTFECITVEDCYPEHVNDPDRDYYFPTGSVIPNWYIQCIDGDCACREPCFAIDDKTGRCKLASKCIKYNPETFQCEDNRKSQTTAVFLSLLLSWIGVANFYICNWLFGTLQLVIFVLVWITGGSAKMFFNARTTERPCLIGMIYFLLGLLPFVLIVWWIVDLVVFIQNSREDSDGCQLIPNY